MTDTDVWQYRIVRGEAAEAFVAALNQAGAEGWEAISGGYGLGESKKMSLGHGMPTTTQAGASAWTALMKRRHTGREPGAQAG